MRIYKLLSFSLALFVFWLFMACVAFVGCVAPINPGQDPLPVRAEQLETTANSAFQLVVDLDNSDRGFWRTNAPAFHNFAEWLREPIQVGTNAPQRRGIEMVLQVDVAKMQYEANKSQSNVLITAISDLEIAANQATAWNTLVKPSTK